jgi:hypothetical protein
MPKDMLIAERNKSDSKRMLNPVFDATFYKLR